MLNVPDTTLGAEKVTVNGTGVFFCFHKVCFSGDGHLLGQQMYNVCLHLHLYICLHLLVYYHINVMKKYK